MNKKITGVVGGILFLSAPFLAAAQVTAAPPNLLETLLAQVAALQEQLDTLKKARGAEHSSAPSSVPPAQCIDLAYNLGVDDTDGVTNGEVTKLQQFLALFPDVYPEARITGYFGPATERAIQRWQRLKNIVSSGDAESTGFGFVGRKTRAALACTSPVEIPPEVTPLPAPAPTPPPSPTTLTTSGSVSAQITSTERFFPTSEVTFSGTAQNTSSVIIAPVRPWDGFESAAYSSRIVPVVNGTWTYTNTLADGNWTLMVLTPDGRGGLASTEFVVVAPTKYDTLRAYADNTLINEAPNNRYEVALNYCKGTLALQYPTQELRCTWGTETIYSRAASGEIQETIRTDGLGTYTGYMNGSVFNISYNIRRDVALANCTLNAGLNPTAVIRCVWNGEEIYSRSAQTTPPPPPPTPTPPPPTPTPPPPSPTPSPYAQSTYYSQGAYTPPPPPPTPTPPPPTPPPPSPSPSPSSATTASCSSSPCVDLKINGSDGPLSLADNQQIQVDWTSAGWNICSLHGARETSNADSAVLWPAGTSGSRTMYAYVTPYTTFILLRCWNEGVAGNMSDYIYLSNSASAASRSNLANVLSALESILKDILSDL